MTIQVKTQNKIIKVPNSARSTNANTNTQITSNSSAVGELFPSRARVNIFSFACHMVSVTVTQVCCLIAKAAKANMQTGERSCFHKTAAGTLKLEFHVIFKCHAILLYFLESPPQWFKTVKVILGSRSHKNRLGLLIWSKRLWFVESWQRSHKVIKTDDLHY